MIRVRISNGEVVNFPDDTPDDVMEKAINEYLGNKPEEKPTSVAGKIGGYIKDVLGESAKGVKEGTQQLFTTPPLGENPLKSIGKAGLGVVNIVNSALGGPSFIKLGGDVGGALGTGVGMGAKALDQAIRPVLPKFNPDEVAWAKSMKPTIDNAPYAFDEDTKNRVNVILQNQPWAPEDVQRAGQIGKMYGETAGSFVGPSEILGVGRMLRKGPKILRKPISEPETSLADVADWQPPTSAGPTRIGAPEMPLTDVADWKPPVSGGPTPQYPSLPLRSQKEITTSQFGIKKPPVPEAAPWDTPILPGTTVKISPYEIAKPLPEQSLPLTSSQEVAARRAGMTTDLPDAIPSRLVDEFGNPIQKPREVGFKQYEAPTQGPELGISPTEAELGIARDAEQLASKKALPEYGRAKNQAEGRIFEAGDNEKIPTVEMTEGSPSADRVKFRPGPLTEDKLYSNPFADPELWLKTLGNPKARAAIGGGIGAMAGDTPEERITYGLTGAGLGYASKWLPLVKEGIRHGLASPENVLGKEGKWLVEAGVHSEENRRSVLSALLTQVENSFKGLSKSEIHNVTRALDTPSTAVDLAAMSPRELNSYQVSRGMFNRFADINELPQDLRVTDYFPRVRDKTVLSQQVKFLENGDYLPSELISGSSMRKHVLPFFERERTATEPATNLGLAPIEAYANATARKIALKGGLHPETGERIPGFISEIEGRLPQIAEKDAPYAVNYINDILGVPTPNKSRLATDVGANIRAYNFARLIAGNLKTPIENLSQQFFTFVRSNPIDFMMGYKDLAMGLAGRNPELLQRLRTAGITGADLSKIDPDITRVQGVIKAASAPFRGSEYLNQAQAYATGLRAAERKGLQGAEANNFAKRLVNETQFNYGKANMPELWRRNEFVKNLGQFKQFSYHYLQLTGKIIKHDLSVPSRLSDTQAAIQRLSQNVNPGNVVEVFNSLPGAQSAKMIIAGTAIFGPDAMFAGIDKTISEVASGSREKYSVEGMLKDKGVPNTFAQGVLPTLGVYAGSMVGLGTLPIEDFKSLAFALPGPTVSGFLDMASVGLTLASTIGGGPGKTFDLSPQALAGGTDIVSQGTDWEKTVSKGLRLLPLGIATDRLRQAYIYHNQESNEFVNKPVGLAQASGREQVTDLNPQKGTIDNEFMMRDVPGMQTVRIATGLMSPKAKKEQETHGSVLDIEKRAQQLTKYAHEYAVATGDTDKAQEWLDDFNEKYGTALHLSSQTMINTIKRNILPHETMEVLQAPKGIKSKAIDIRREVFGE